MGINSKKLLLPCLQVVSYNPLRFAILWEIFENCQLKTILNSKILPDSFVFILFFYRIYLVVGPVIYVFSKNEKFHCSENCISTWPRSVVKMILHNYLFWKTCTRNGNRSYSQVVPGPSFWYFRLPDCYAPTCCDFCQIFEKYGLKDY